MGWTERILYVGGGGPWRGGQEPRLDNDRRVLAGMLRDQLLAGATGALNCGPGAGDDDSAGWALPGTGDYCWRRRFDGGAGSNWTERRG